MRKILWFCIRLTVVESNSQIDKHITSRTIGPLQWWKHVSQVSEGSQVETDGSTEQATLPTTWPTEHMPGVTLGAVPSECFIYFPFPPNVYVSFVRCSHIWNTRVCSLQMGLVLHTEGLPMADFAMVSQLISLWNWNISLTEQWAVVYLLIHLQKYMLCVTHKLLKL